MIDITLSQFSESELRRLCSYITGASSQRTGKQFDFKIVKNLVNSPSESWVVNAPTCSKMIYINLVMFEALYKNLNNLEHYFRIDFKSHEVQRFFKDQLIFSMNDHFNSL